MADAAERAEFETKQVENKRLAERLAAWEPVSPERRRLEREVIALDQEVSALTTQLAAAGRRELAARDAYDSALDLREAVRGRWWMSKATPFAIGGALIVGFILANKSLDHLNWPYWAERLGPWFLAVPVAVNLARLLPALLRFFRTP